MLPYWTKYLCLFQLTTLGGESITVKKKFLSLSLESNSGHTNIKIGDIETDEIPNGLVHVIDKVLT